MVMQKPRTMHDLINNSRTCTVSINHQKNSRRLRYAYQRVCLSYLALTRLKTKMSQDAPIKAYPATSIFPQSQEGI